jgi:uncharacterized protein YgbK (DUF1537 family)
MPLLGCIADDFTGATDLGSLLVRGQMRCVQWLGIPSQLPATQEVDAIVVSLKSRSAPPEEAIRDSLDALYALQRAGCQRFFFKYCSTFDSTDRGNIGPVAEALGEALGAPQMIFCPAFPENGRTVYLGHLFVGGALLSESGMQHHPLNPMTDSNLVRVLHRQSRGPVGLVPCASVEQGPPSIRAQLAELHKQGIRLVIADAVSDEHLAHWAEVAQEHPLVTGGSAIARHLARAYRRHGLLDNQPSQPHLPRVKGLAAVLAGSCSRATQRQVAAFAAQRPVFPLDPRRLAAGESVVPEALDWAAQRLTEGPVLIASTAPPAEIQSVTQALGNRAAELVEVAMGQIAAGLVQQGVRKLVVAGGETSGAVLRGIGVTSLRIGPQIDPGVPWTESLDEPRMALALKSGNFGEEDLFLRAFEMLT